MQIINASPRWDGALTVRKGAATADALARPLLGGGAA
jgi:hypothetical protein